MSKEAVAEIAKKLGVDVDKFPTATELLKMLKDMKLSDKEREEIERSLLQDGPKTAAEDMFSSAFPSQALLFVAMLSIIVFILAFFAYKAYRSLTERDRKREEKKKMKEMKKKKK